MKLPVTVYPNTGTVEFSTSRRGRRRKYQTVAEKREVERRRASGELPRVGRGKKYDDREARLVRKYGLTADQLSAIIERQGRRCAICRDPFVAGRGHNGRASSLSGYACVVDHDHSTGAIRGVLCSRCNTAIGLFGDSAWLLLRARQYLTTAAAAWRVVAKVEG